MVNSHRGEVAVRLDGQDYRLCLSLGALAEIETVLGGPPGTDGARQRSLSATDMLSVLAALLAGGGNPVSMQALRAMPIDIDDAAAAITAALQAGHT